MSCEQNIKMEYVEGDPLNQSAVESDQETEKQVPTK